jgi:hypothetical protein
MSTDDRPPSRPWSADPAMGPVIGMTFLLFCLVGPFALLVPLIGWLVIRHRRQARTQSATDREFAERFHELESGIADEPPPSPTRPKRARPRRRPDLR